jgi:biopolymer transport protein ExbB
MSDLIVVKIFEEGGLIMWPILATSIVAVGVIVERFIWWRGETKKRDLLLLDQVFAALEKKDIGKASSLAGGSQDSVLRVLWYGLNHSHSSFQGALQVSAGIELKRAGRFIVVLDTIVTLAPLLGLLGTVSGLMSAFFKLGNTELSEEAITGGIAEALIATACGLGIAIVALVFLNYYSSKLADFQFDIQTACSNAEVLLSGSASPAPSVSPAVREQVSASSV